MSDKTIQAKASGEHAANELPLVEKIVLRLVATIFGVIGFGLAIRAFRGLREDFAEGEIVMGLATFGLISFVIFLILLFVWKAYTNPSAFKSNKSTSHRHDESALGSIESRLHGIGPFAIPDDARSQID